MNLKAYSQHTAWLIAERIFRLSLAVCIFALMARALGPTDFGRLSWALSVVALFAPFVGLGFDSLLAKWLIRNPELSGQYLGTTFALKFSTALLVNILFIIAYISGIIPDMKLIMVLGLVLVAQTSSLLDQYYKAHVEGRKCAIIQIKSLIVGAIFKFAVILGGGGLFEFALAIVFEQFLLLLLFVSAFNRDNRHSVRFKLGRIQASKLLQESWPLIISASLGVLFLVVDQLMLRALVGPEEVGIYSAAARITEAWYALLAVLAGALYPAILRAGKNLDTVMQFCYEISISLSILIAVIITFVSPWIIELLYGKEFNDSIPVLVIHIWSGVFIGLRLFSGKWMLSEGLTRLLLYRSIVGLSFNIILGLILIPVYGAIGAAVSTLLAHILVGFIFDFFNPITRSQGMLKFKSLAFPILTRKIRNYL